MKKILYLAMMLLVAFAAVSCTKEDKITDTLTLRGNTYKIVHAICGGYEAAFYNMDIDTEEGIHGYGGFDADWVGKTTDLKGRFFLSFNPMSGNSIDPVVKSGTVTIKKVEKGMNVIVDAVEETGDKLKMSVFVEDMGQNF